MTKPMTNSMTKTATPTTRAAGALRAAILLPAALAASLTLGACAREIGATTVAGVQAGETMRTEVGIIESARPVRVREKALLEQNRTGLAIGGAAGGYLGHELADELGGGHRSRILAAAGGALVGATAGALTERGLKTQMAMEYVFRNEIGQLRTIVQGPEPRLAPGQRVYLKISSRGRSRLVPAGY